MSLCDAAGTLPAEQPQQRSVLQTGCPLSQEYFLLQAGLLELEPIWDPLCLRRRRENPGFSMDSVRQNPIQAYFRNSSGCTGFFLGLHTQILVSQAHILEAHALDSGCSNPMYLKYMVINVPNSFNFQQCNTESPLQPYTTLLSSACFVVYY